MHRESASLDGIGGPGSGVTGRDFDRDTHSGGESRRRLITQDHARADADADAGGSLDEAGSRRR